ncbi:MAG TPA: DGQHR domain-containing protein [Puia sp.]|nr:DGQHR domain-containing protein [Puia sp.]
MKNPSHRISVIVPDSPFAKQSNIEHCLCAIDVEKLMEWWPGHPHSPHRNAAKVTAIQRSLDWKRVAQIAAYLLQNEIRDIPEKINKYFGPIYEPKKNEPGRQWPPKVSKVVGYERSVFPTFSNVLIHVNGAKVVGIRLKGEQGAAKLVFNEKDPKLNFSVIDGQHRINGAYLAICILKEKVPTTKWEIPADIFLNLDPIGAPPTKQAQIFIDVNFYQKKVDRSLVADLFPTARGNRDSLDDKERAQDIGRKLMLEVGPLVGMIQIPGIKYGVKDVITLSTLNTAIENLIGVLESQEISSLEMQTEFLAQVLDSWAKATGSKSNTDQNNELDPENVAYQGRVLVSVLTLVPAMLWNLKSRRIRSISDSASKEIEKLLKEVAMKAGLLNNEVFISKSKFKAKGYLGSGGIAKFRDSLWAAVGSKKKLTRISPARISMMAETIRSKVFKALNIE